MSYYRHKEKNKMTKQMLKKVEEIAREAHEGQTRWDGSPYINHPKAVAEQFNNFDCKIVSWLHDVIEDTNLTEQSLLDSGIPKYLVNSVVLLTKFNNVNYKDYILNIKKNDIARVVKIEDIKHNLSDLAEGDKKQKYELALYILGDKNE